jgi:hypothetical protein
LLAITAAIQPPWSTLRRWVKDRDPCAYIPTWTFFAPSPGVKDIRLLWREQLVDGTAGPWHEAVPPRQGLLRALWNPTKRTRKVVFDCRGRLKEAHTSDYGERGELYMLSVSYLLMIQHVTRLPASPFAAARQFVLVETQGADEEDGRFELLFVSPWHFLPGASRDPEPEREKGPEPVGPAA